MARIDELASRFVGRLERLHKEDDRATLAHLRRGLGKPPGFAPQRDGWVLSQRVPLSKEDLCCLIASLFALHPEPGGKGTLGAAFARLRASVGGDGPERRFAALLDTDVEDLPGRLRHAVSLLKSKDIPVDWRQLLRDIHFWSHSERFVQRRWARDFWSAAETEQSPAAAETTTQTNQ